MSLQFGFGATQNEIEHWIKTTESFLQSPHVLQAWLAKLRWLEKQPAGQATAWAISRDDPIVTKPARNSQFYGTLSSTWDIRSLRRNKRRFEIYDNASTTVKVLRTGTGEVVGHWNFDIGTANSPGCHFHAQLPGWDAAGLDVPRFPIPFVLPVDALDFLLGELFQHAWEVQSANRTDAFQRTRMTQMFDWSKRVIEGSHAAWMKLKTAKPAPDFLG